MSTPGGPLDPRQDPDRFDPDRDGAPSSAPPGRSNDPQRKGAPGGPLDMSKDPDRFDALGDEVDLRGVQRPRARRLDPAADPDRFRGGDDDPLRAPTLPGLLGAGAQEDERDTYTWVLGLLSVVVFLGLVAFLFGRVLSG